MNLSSCFFPLLVSLECDLYLVLECFPRVLTRVIEVKQLCLARLYRKYKLDSNSLYFLIEPKPIFLNISQVLHLRGAWWNGLLVWDLMTWKVKGDSSAWKPKCRGWDCEIMVGSMDDGQCLRGMRSWSSFGMCPSFVKSMPDRVPKVQISPSLCKRKKTSPWLIWSHDRASVLKCFGLKIPLQS